MRIRKPTHLREFLLIVLNELSSRGRDDVPQRYINVPRSEADGRRTRNHQGPRDGVAGNKPELFEEFAQDCLSWVFAWLDMAPGRQPELRGFVINEQYLATVNHGKV